MQSEESSIKLMETHKRKNNMFDPCMNNNHHHEESESQDASSPSRIGSPDHESVAIVRKESLHAAATSSENNASSNLLLIPEPSLTQVHGQRQNLQQGLLHPHEPQKQQYEINRRSRSNSIAAGAIARLKNLPQIRLSLPPEDLILYQSNAATATSASHHQSFLIHESLPESPTGSSGNSNTSSTSTPFDHLPIHHPLHPVNRVLGMSSSASPSSTSPGVNSFLTASTLHQRRGLATGIDANRRTQLNRTQRKKVLDQKDLNLKPEKDVRRNSLPINDSQLLGINSPSSPIHIRFLSETAGRRLSQVSSVVSAQIQSTIGWRSLISEEDVIDQAKCLAAKFVWIKLRKSGFCHKRFHLQRLRSVCNFTDNEDIDRTLNQVTAELRALSHELESAHPKIFNSVLNQVGPNCFKSITTVTKTQILVGQFLFSCQEITWTHVAAFFTITAALALDSVISGHHDFVMPLIDSFADFANGDLSQWIVQEGGWETLLNKYREEDEWMRKFRWIIFLLALVFVMVAVIFIY